jgi:hypothetical protein
VGLSERMLYILASPIAVKAFAAEQAKEADGKGHGISQAEMDTLAVKYVNYFQLDTTNYDRVPA